MPESPSVPVGSPVRSSPSPSRNEWPLLHLSFVLIGIITTFLSPILPFFIHRWSLSDAQAGFFFTSQYFGSFLGVALTSVFLPRFGFSKVSAAGFLAFMVGFAFLGMGPWIISAIMVGVNGFGYGLANPAINLRATQLPSRNTAAAVTFLNFSWSLGAVLCPILIGFLLPSVGLRGFAAAVAVLSLVLIFSHLSTRSAPVVAVRATHPLSEWLSLMRRPTAIALLLLFFLYVGVEVAIGGWVASYQKRMPGMETVTLLLAPSVFYGFLLLGRGVAPLLLHRISQVVISAGGLLLATFGTIIIVLSDSPHPLYLGAALAGFGLAPQYPILVTWLAATFQEDSPWIGSLFFGAAGLGGGAIPGLVGVAAAQTHSLRAGFYIPLVVTFVMFFLALRAHPRSAHA